MTSSETAAEILGLRSLIFIEPQYSSLADPRFSTLLHDIEAESARLLIDEHDNPIGIAVKGTDGWIASSFLHRAPTVSLIERCEDLSAEILFEEREIWASSVREYFSTRLATEIPPAPEDLNPKRYDNLISLIESVWGPGSGESCIESCCGSGLGSQALRSLGYSPLSYDHDSSTLSCGLHMGRLRPSETLWIDAEFATLYLQPVKKGIGLMLGEITSFNQHIWERIVTELLVLSQETLITVGTEEEVLLIKGWGEYMDRECTILTNPDDPLYDHWICQLTGR